MKIRTEVLKGLLAKAVKGAGNNKLIPITEFIGIRAQDDVLMLETTDATNYLYVKVNSPGDEFYAVADVDLFSKLVAKTTSEFVELKVSDTAPILQFVGNGNYSIEMPLDEDGRLVQYPDPVTALGSTEDLTDISKSAVAKILTSVKPSLATTFENPCYTGYYLGDEVLATDTFKIAGFDEKLFEEPVLMSPQTMDLLGLVSDDRIKVAKSGDRFVFTSSDITIYSPEMEGKADFAVDAITGLLGQEFDFSCELPKQELLNVLDRLSLFINPYDKNELRLTFTEEGLQISSKAESGIEVIPYFKKPDEFVPFVCSVDIEMLTQEVKAVSSERIELHYGEDNAIKFVDGDVTIVLALLGE